MRTSMPVTGDPTHTTCCASAVPSRTGSARCASATACRETWSMIAGSCGDAQRHDQGGFGEPVGGHRRSRPHTEARADGGEVGDIAVVDGFGSVHRYPKRREVDAARIGALQHPGEHRVREVGSRGDGRAVPADQLRPDERSLQELLRWDDDGFDAQLHGHTDEGDHPHVVRERQPARQHVRVDVEVQRVVQAMALAARLPWLISTALGAPVDPDVNCRSAISDIVGFRTSSSVGLGAAQGFDGADGQVLGRQVIQRRQELARRRRPSRP